MDQQDSPVGRREQKKAEVRRRISEAIVALLAEGRFDLSHDLVAERTGIARRTIYRYFPDRDALLNAAWDRVRTMMGEGVQLPGSPRDLVEMLPAVFAGFDAIAPVATLIRTTPQGRALRLAGNARRTAAFCKATAEIVKDLSEEDRLLATAMLQFLFTTPWLEMRDIWGLSGEQIARVSGWAMRTLIADLEHRNGRPLDSE